MTHMTSQVKIVLLLPIVDTVDTFSAYRECSIKVSFIRHIVKDLSYTRTPPFYHQQRS